VRQKLLSPIRSCQSFCHIDAEIVTEAGWILISDGMLILLHADIQGLQCLLGAFNVQRPDVVHRFMSGRHTEVARERAGGSSRLATCLMGADAGHGLLGRALFAMKRKRYPIEQACTAPASALGLVILGHQDKNCLRSRRNQSIVVICHATAPSVGSAAL